MIKIHRPNSKPDPGDATCISRKHKPSTLDQISETKTGENHSFYLSTGANPPNLPPTITATTPEENGH